RDQLLEGEVRSQLHHTPPCDRSAVLSVTLTGNGASRGRRLTPRAARSRPATIEPPETLKTRSTLVSVSKLFSRQCVPQWKTLPGHYRLIARVLSRLHLPELRELWV